MTQSTYNPDVLVSSFAEAVIATGIGGGLTPSQVGEAAMIVLVASINHEGIPVGFVANYLIAHLLKLEGLFHEAQAEIDAEEAEAAA